MAPKPKKPTPSVKVITPSETAMKKGKLKGSNSSGSKGAAVPKGGASRPQQYKPRKLSDTVLKQQSTKPKGAVPSNAKPPKPPTPPTPPKSKAKGGRGMGGFGGSLFGSKNR